MSEDHDLAVLIGLELRRQADDDPMGGYVGMDFTVDDTSVLDVSDVVLDGHFDLKALALAILDGGPPEPEPALVTGKPLGKPVIWSEYVHKDWMQNMNHRTHFRAKNNKTQLVKTLGKVRHRHLGKYDRARLDIVVSYPARFSADVHNYMPTAKAYVDGLIDVPDTPKGQKKQPARGIMTDDSDAYLAGPFLHPGSGGSDRRDHFRLDCILQPLTKN